MAKPIGKPDNRLTQVEFFHLCEALRTHQDAINQRRCTWEEAAKLLAEKTGRPVTEANVRSACEATGVTWERAGQSRGSPLVAVAAKVERVAVEVAETHRLLAQLREDVNECLRALYLIYHDAGSTLPPTFPVRRELVPVNGKGEPVTPAVRR